MFVAALPKYGVRSRQDNGLGGFARLGEEIMRFQIAKESYFCLRAFLIVNVVLVHHLAAPPPAYGQGTGASKSSAAAQKSQGRTVSSKMDGLYRAFPFVPQFGMSIGEAYVFSASGDVYKGWPRIQGANKFDFVRAKRQEAGSTGKYVLSGDKITFRWSNGESDTVYFRNRRDRDTGKTDMAIGTYHIFKLAPWGKPLNSTFDAPAYQGGFSEPDKENVNIVDSITFSLEGRFTITEGDKGSVPLQGRYKVSGTALILTMPNNKERVYSLHVFEDHSQPPKAILLNGRPFNARVK